MNMNMDLSIYEVIDMLYNGSTNQQQFMDSIVKSGNNVFSVIRTLDDHIGLLDVTDFDLRGLLNGGVLTFEELTNEIKGNYYTIEFKNNFGLVFY